MKLFHQTSFSKKFVVPSVAVFMTLASTMFMAPVLAVGFFLDQSLQTNSDSSLTATYRARGFSAEGKDQPQTRETTIELKGESDNFDMGSNDGEVSIGPPSTTAEDLCHTSKLDVELESITYTDIVLHAIPNDSNEEEVTHEFEDVGPITP